LIFEELKNIERQPDGTPVVPKTSSVARLQGRIASIPEEKCERDRLAPFQTRRYRLSGR